VIGSENVQDVMNSEFQIRTDLLITFGLKIGDSMGLNGEMIEGLLPAVSATDNPFQFRENLRNRMFLDRFSDSHVTCPMVGCARMEIRQEAYQSGISLK
jgi:hypothetical protein